jgi:hypothetical protein
MYLEEFLTYPTNKKQQKKTDITIMLLVVRNSHTTVLVKRVGW